MMVYDLVLKTTDGHVKAGRFATVSLSRDELRLMQLHLASSPIAICEQPKKEASKPEVRKATKKAAK